MTANARIAVARTFGAPEVITIESHPAAPLPRGGIRVAVRIGGLNPVDARRRAGKFGGQVPMVFGTEFAGIVVESTDSRFSVGDEVIGWGAQGSNSDLVVTDASRLEHKPVNLTWEQAGGLSGVGQTALTALNALPLKSGQLIVVHGASGGVGTALVQLARTRGLDVIGTAGASNQEYVRSMGATAVEYGSGLEQRIVDAAQGRPIAASIDLAGTREAGDIAVKVQKSGGQAITLVPETMQSHGLRLVSVRHSHQQLQELFQAIANGTLKLPVATLPFTEIVEAHRRLDSKHAQGKLVLDLSDNPFLTDPAGFAA